MPSFKDLTGQKFGRLTVNKLSRRVKSGKRYRYYWDCTCDCGNHKEVRTDSLTCHQVQSCGCLHDETAAKNVEKNHTHKMSKTSLYKKYQTMKKRCSDPNDQRYADYGGRGIKVCEEWVNSAESFLEWALSHGYEEGLQIDRIDNEKGYSPENCRFVTQKENCRNRRSNVMIEQEDGTYITLVELAEKLDMDYKHVYHLYRKKGVRRSELVEISKHRANQLDDEKAS